jgi:23S rRNA (cytidine1920-2'-O)/16S rRNA (cytidine1409-2'-O)-methyltransferase
MRVDVFLALNQYAKSRSAAQALIDAGSVIINGKTVTKASDSVDENAENNVVITKTQKFVGRGGYKLEYALEKFKIDVSGKTAIDVGASTGGFTDCLLQRGAEKVFAVDAGEGQLDASLVSNPKVVNIEKYNARNLNREDFVDKIDVAVMDVSFISQTLILPSLSSLLDDGAVLVSLIKPQFEVGRSAIGKKGIVKNPKDRKNAVMTVVEVAKALGLGCLGVYESVITGGDGNIEYVAAFKKGEKCAVNFDLQR